MSAVKPKRVTGAVKQRYFDVISALVFAVAVVVGVVVVGSFS